MATPSDSNHELLAEQLPLLAAGTLAHEDAARLRAHVAGCRACEDELAALAAARAATAAHYEPFSRRSPQASLARVLARVDADRHDIERHRAARQSWLSRITPWWSGWPGGARWLALTQAASAALLVAGMIAWPARETAVFESASGPPAATAIGRITVAFADSARAVDIAALLADLDATIVNGPTAAGFYTLQLTSRSPRDAVIRLRARADLVRYAEAAAVPK